MKKVFLVALSVSFLMSCSNSKNKKQEMTEEQVEIVDNLEEANVVEVIEEVKFISPEEKFANKTIKVKGEAGTSFKMYYFDLTLHSNGYATDHFKSHEVVKVRGVDRWYDNGEKKGTWSMFTKEMGANTIVVFEVAIGGNKHYFTENFDYYFRSDDAYFAFRSFDTDKAFKIVSHSVE